MKKYPVVAVCVGSKLDEKCIQICDMLTRRGKIAILTGGLDPVKADGPVDENRRRICDMNRKKIDMADEIFAANFDGDIDHDMWSEICYARMTRKKIRSVEFIHRDRIDKMVRKHIREAEKYAAWQYDQWSHLASDYSSPESLLRGMAVIQKDKYVTMDPWVPEDDSIQTVSFPYIGHADRRTGFNPFRQYGRRKMAGFVEEVIMLNENNGMANRDHRRRKKLTEDIEAECEATEIPLPDGFPEEMSTDKMEKWIGIWSDYNPYPESD